MMQIKIDKRYQQIISSNKKLIKTTT